MQVNFLGLPLHFDMARQWNVKQNLSRLQAVLLHRAGVLETPASSEA
jgi:hypothetical protein